MLSVLWAGTPSFTRQALGVATQSKTKQISPDAMANEATRKGKSVEAIKLYKQALAVSPEYYDARYNLTLLYIQIKDYESAEKSADDLVKIGPTAEAFTLQGIIYVERNNIPKAETSFLNAVRINPKRSSAHEGLGEVYSRIGDRKKELASLKIANDLNPKSANLQNNLGRAYQLSDDLGLAIVHYKIAVSLNPRRAEFHYNLGDALFFQESYSEALAQLKQARALDAGIEGLDIRLATTYDRLNLTKVRKLRIPMMFPFT